MNAHITGRNVTVRTTVADTPDTRAAARKLACQEAHTATIGKLLKVDDAPTGATYTWGPVTAPARRGGSLVKATPVPLTGEALVASVVPNLDTLGKRELRELVARLITTTVAPAPVKATPAREVPEFIVKAAAKRAAVTCTTCRDLKVVRGVGSDAGKPYRTQKGADAATAAGRSVKCPTHKRASKTA